MKIRREKRTLSEMYERLAELWEEAARKEQRGDGVRAWRLWHARELRNLATAGA